LAVGCAAAGLSNAGSACKDILDLGFSLGRTGIMLCEFKGGSATLVERQKGKRLTVKFFLLHCSAFFEVTPLPPEPIRQLAESSAKPIVRQRGTFSA